MAAAEGSDGGKMIVLISNDGRRFELPEAAAKLSQIVSYMIEDGCASPAIPLPNVDGDTLAKVVEYCTMHAAVLSDTASERTSKERELEAFDTKFIDVGDVTTLFELIMAANYLNVKGLLDLACRRTADLFKNKTPEEIRQTFGIENDLTPEEEAAIREENAWAFEGY